jgi:hypothetical protein
MSNKFLTGSTVDFYLSQIASNTQNGETDSVKLTHIDNQTLAIQNSTGSMDTKLTTSNTDTGLIQTNTLNSNTNLGFIRTSTANTDTNTSGSNTKLGVIQTQTTNTATSTGSIDTKMTTSNTNTGLIQTNTLNSNTNLGFIRTNTANTVSGITTTNGWLQSSDGRLTTINTNTLNTYNELSIQQTPNIVATAIQTYQALLPTYDCINLKANPNTPGYLDNGGKQYSTLVTIGSTSNVFSTETQISSGMTSGQFMYHPQTAATWQVASSNIGDTIAGGLGCQILIVTGWVSSTNNMGGTWTLENEVVLMNGQTPVTTTKTFIRPYVAFCFQSGGSMLNSPIGKVNLGIISVIQTGSTTFTAGVPVDLTKRISYIEIGDGINFNGLLTIPPNYSFFFSDLSAMLGSTATVTCVIKLYGNTYTGTTSSTGYRELARFMTTDSQPNLQSHNFSLPDVCLPPNGLYGTDLILSVFRPNGNTNSVLLECIVNGILVKNS